MIFASPAQTFFIHRRHPPIIRSLRHPFGQLTPPRTRARHNSRLLAMPSRGNAFLLMVQTHGLDVFAPSGHPYTAAAVSLAITYPLIPSHIPHLVSCTHARWAAYSLACIFEPSSPGGFFFPQRASRRRTARLLCRLAWQHLPHMLSHVC